MHLISQKVIQIVYRKCILVDQVIQLGKAVNDM